MTPRAGCQRERAVSSTLGWHDTHSDSRNRPIYVLTVVKGLGDEAHQQDTRFASVLRAFRVPLLILYRSNKTTPSTNQICNTQRHRLVQAQSTHIQTASTPERQYALCADGGGFVFLPAHPS